MIAAAAATGPTVGLPQALMLALILFAMAVLVTRRTVALPFVVATSGAALFVWAPLSGIPGIQLSPTTALILAAAVAFVPVLAVGTPRRATVDLAAAAEWKKHIKMHDRVIRRYRDMLNETGLMLSAPALADPNEPATAAFLTALKLARDNYTPLPPEGVAARDIHLLPYPSAVWASYHALEAAHAEAVEVGRSNLDEENLSRFRLADTLSHLIRDNYAPAAERNLARKRLDKVIADYRASCVQPHTRPPVRHLRVVPDRR